ncbi:response regulator transcription factor [Alicyclobacillus sp. ALC3]|uniref:response regulator transcription factor n=1 Tax=Alicyclobacillus sp. ALC3 TaxID=2796143 RepID=UPI002377D353|nr:response regulator transcription factor [Alicyclobacillus sp. ALC3]WDL95931.1 response regulator transcription factor [Alicyclobacillus sp. ALC3]
MNFVYGEWYTMHHILVVDDEPEIRTLVRKHLEQAGWHVVEAASGRQAVEQMQKYRIELLILDLMMDDLNGFDVLQLIRRSDSDTPVIVLSARGDIPDKVDTLDLGADDFMTKPFSPMELVARVQAHLRRHRRHSSDQSEVIRLSALVLDVDNRLLHNNGKRSPLTDVECRLLQLFMRNPDRVLTKREIYQHVWNHENFDSNNLSVFISRLRSLLGDASESPLHLQSVRGVGYRFSGDGL